MSGHANQGIHGDYPAGPLTDGPEDNLTVANDYRAVMAEVCTKRLGNPQLDQVFPGYAHTGDLGVVDAGAIRPGPRRRGEAVRRSRSGRRRRRRWPGPRTAPW